jgi:hypothetical protein
MNYLTQVIELQIDDKKLIIELDISKVKQQIPVTVRVDSGKEFKIYHLKGEIKDETLSHS